MAHVEKNIKSVNHSQDFINLIGTYYESGYIPFLCKIYQNEITDLILAEKKQKQINKNLYHEILSNKSITHEFLNNAFVPDEED